MKTKKQEPVTKERLIEMMLNKINLVSEDAVRRTNEIGISAFSAMRKAATGDEKLASELLHEVVADVEFYIASLNQSQRILTELIESYDKIKAEEKQNADEKKEIKMRKIEGVSDWNDFVADVQYFLGEDGGYKPGSFDVLLDNGYNHIRIRFYTEFDTDNDGRFCNDFSIKKEGDSVWVSEEDFFKGLESRYSFPFYICDPKTEYTWL